MSNTYVVAGLSGLVMELFQGLSQRTDTYAEVRVLVLRGGMFKRAHRPHTAEHAMMPKTKRSRYG